ncbi:sulfotransferase domain-containing protein [Emticicia sp. CRIBPO]|uniref:sulfotransferase domain-containing protein n=1 Tax=Emticicia sp. CRIBPO TaxID=2683258 RepID=UPI001411CB59|nr:sulfotransferase domain-containing protein [Emticicia sp. CRIBPO]NBA88070.1 sulfotransferase domain-containing protein [Emticicia sp. CRIBPO]
MKINKSKKRIIWLASYPKSGNTWFRAFLTALHNDGKVDINDLVTNGIFSSRLFLKDQTDLDSTLLTNEETKILLPEAYSCLPENNLQEKFYFKIHDAYSSNTQNRPIIPSESTHCAIYIVRNPLDIAASLANHNSSTIDEAIELMNNKKACFALQENNLNNYSQTEQLLFDWSGHVNSWMSGPDFPVHLIRYEDLINDPLRFFTYILKKSGIVFPKDKIIRAIDASQFTKLKGQEKILGFSEKTLQCKSFFRNGKANNWQQELNKHQVSAIWTQHSEVMKTLGYML